MAGPSRIPDIKALREMNLNSVDVLTKAPQDFLEADISALELEIRIPMIVQMRLQAASIRVKPLSAADVQKLESLVDCPTNNWTQETACSRARLDLDLVPATVVSEPRL